MRNDNWVVEYGGKSMTKTKKKTILFLGITILLLVFFAVAMIGQSVNTRYASAASYDSADDIKSHLASLMVNGYVPQNKKMTSGGTAIGNADQLRAFLSSGSGKGYLTGDINDFSWDGGCFTRRLMSSNVTELNGNGFKIKLTATSLANATQSLDLGVADGDLAKGDTNWAVFRDNFDDTALYTYAGTTQTRKNLDLHGGLIGYLRPGQTIRNCNFEYNQNVELSYQTSNCATFGLIVAYSLGNIDNCSLTIGGSVNIFADTLWTSSVTDYQQETLSKHSFALGGYAGTMSTNSRVSNSKITLNGNLIARVQGKNIKGGGGEFMSCYARAWAGGIVGWMANAAQVYNVVAEGSGNLEAKAENPQKSRTLSFSGIISGIAGGNKDGSQGSIVGLIKTCGRIDGVINNWTGYAKYWIDEAQYSPTNVKDNEQQYLITGVSGFDGSSDSMVENIYVNKGIYGVETGKFSVGYDYATEKGVYGYNKGNYTSTVIIMQDVLGNSTAGSMMFKEANAKNASLKFSDTDIGASLWAVYDISGENVILWSKEVTNTSTNSTDLAYYYNQATSIEDAKRFDVTYTEIPRNQNQGRRIRYTHGVAVYSKKVYPTNSDVSNTSKVILPNTSYGSPLSVPTIEVYLDAGYTKLDKTFRSESSFWVTMSDKNNMIVDMPRTAVDAGTYESFIYTKNANGMDYSYINFLKADLRYISYIYDDPAFKAYRDTHPGYEPVKNNEKQIEWQERAVQTVNPASPEVNWGIPADMDRKKGAEFDLEGNYKTFGHYETQYDGEPVSFDLNVSASDLVKPDDVCKVNYEFKVYNAVKGEYEVTDSCVNVGAYKVVVTALSNSNYKLRDDIAQGYDYCIDFNIVPRQIHILDRTGATLSADGKAYDLQVQYQAFNIDFAIDYQIAVCFDEAEAKRQRANIVVWNVLDINKSMIDRYYLPVDGDVVDRLNVGRFDMVIGLLSGTNSSNYIMPDAVTYKIEIVPTDANFVVEDKYTYTYGNYFEDKVTPTAMGIGNDGELGFILDRTNYIQLLDSGEEITLGGTPFNAGRYRIEYYFEYPNYKTVEVIPVNVEITKRVVKVNYAYNSVEFTYGERIIRDIPADLSRQNVVDNTGIINSQYPALVPKYKFYLLDEHGYRIKDGNNNDKYVTKVEDYGISGIYEGEIEIEFDPEARLPIGVVVDENTKNNYVVSNDLYTVTVVQKEINIIMNDVERTYGDDTHKFVGDASASAKVRSWSYLDENVTFDPKDDIVVMPYLSNEDRFAPVTIAGYEVLTDRAHWSGVVDERTSIDTVNNYNIIVTNGKYVVKPRVVKVKVTLNTDSVVYGYELPQVVSILPYGDNNFFEDDEIQLEADMGELCVGSKVDTYYVGAKIVASGKSGNYALDVEEGRFEITPRLLTILSAMVEEGKTNVEYLFDGDVHTPEVTIEYAEELYAGDSIDFTYNYFEIIDGEVSPIPTSNPANAGVYRVYLADASSSNYTIVFGESYERDAITMTIKKRQISIEVYPGYRIYSIKDSVTPIVTGAIDTSENSHYPTREEAIKMGLGDILTAPFKYTQGDSTPRDEKFVESIENLGAQMYVGGYFKNLDVQSGVVMLVFNGLARDPKAIDGNGDWLTHQEEFDGEIFDVISPAYRNYDITMIRGDLHELGNDLANMDQYINLRSKEEVYDGTDKYENFRVETTNDNILAALTFRIFRYVEISTLSAAEADALAAPYGRFTQYVNEDGELDYESDPEGTYVRKYVKRIELGDTIDEALVNAGQYFKHVTSADESIFTGEYITSFYISKASRDLAIIEVKSVVNYNKITLSCDVEGMVVSINDGGFARKATFDNLSPDTEYTFKVKFTESANYLETDVIELTLRTGINISAIVATVNKLNKIDFTNVTEFETKVLAFIGRISEEDMSLIDQAKFAKLQSSYNQLLKGASSVVKGAQNVGAKAVGKSGQSSKTAARTIALSGSGIGVLLAAGFMVSRKKREEKNAKARGSRKFGFSAGRYAAVILLVIVVCAVALVGCDGTENKGFQKQDLYKIASYQSDAANKNGKLTIEVKVGDISLYKYEDGKETIHKNIDADAMSFGADGIGFEFDDMYFDNMEFKVENGEATFKADIRETLVFLGVESASNGKVSVSVDVGKKSLKTLDVTYDIVNSSGTYNVSVSVR